MFCLQIFIYFLAFLEKYAISFVSFKNAIQKNGSEKITNREQFVLNRQKFTNGNKQMKFPSNRYP